MKQLLMLCIISILSINTCFSQVTLSGKIWDKLTNKPLIDASIFIPDLQIGSTSKQDGSYKINNLPKGKFLVEVQFIGYETVIVNINLLKNQKHNFYLVPYPIKEHEVVITGSAIPSDIDGTSVPIVSIGKNVLETTASTNIIDALSSVPGVSEITTGPGVSKPVIRGLAFNNVVTINEGVRQEENQWGPEHGISIDQFTAGRIEILKGPASLLYGSDALGGVINILEPKMPSAGTIRGEVVSRYSTNDQLTANSLMVEGNNSGFVWNVRATYKDAASYKAPGYYVYNSGFNEVNYSAVLGLHKEWGYTNLHLSRFDGHYGGVDGTKDSLTNQFVNDEGEIVPTNKLDSRVLALPFNNVVHTEVTSVSNIIFNDYQLKINVGFQSNHRREFDDNTTIPNVYFLLNTLTYNGKLLFPEKNGFETAIGLSGMTQTNQNKGNEYVVPDYFLQDLGGFVYVKKSFYKFTMNGGIRFDYRKINGNPLFLNAQGKPTSTSSDTIFKAFKSNFNSFSGAIGFTYAFNKNLDAKFNIGRGYRAPNIYELATSMNGAAPDPGTFCFNAGNYNLKPQTSVQIDGEILFTNELLDGTLSAFYNHINNYIYQRNIDNEMKKFDNQWYPVYRFVQGNSLLKGFECTLNIHPGKTFNFENTISYVNGTNLSTNIPLPFIPAMHSKHEIKWYFTKENSNTFFSGSYIKAGIEHVWPQTRYDVFETPTAAYTLINMELGSNIKIGQQRLTIFIDGENLGDVKYFNNMNRFKVLNIYNPGRNITFGIYFPFSYE